MNAPIWRAILRVLVAGALAWLPILLALAYAGAR